MHRAVRRMQAADASISLSSFAQREGPRNESGGLGSIPFPNRSRIAYAQAYAALPSSSLRESVSRPQAVEPTSVHNRNDSLPLLFLLNKEFDESGLRMPRIPRQRLREEVIIEVRSAPLHRGREQSPLRLEGHRIWIAEVGNRFEGFRDEVRMHLRQLG